MKFLQERLGLEQLNYPIPVTANWLRYMLGGLTLVGIVVLVATGVILDQFYNPTPVGAHDSMIYIVTRVRFGEWLRALHYWAATFVLVSVTFHLLWVFWRRSYARPREVTWWSGAALLLLLFALAFTGTVLRADQEGGEALAHALVGAKMVGPAGAIMSADFAGATSLIARLHGVHVSLLPLLLFLLVALHFWLIRLHGIHSGEAKTSAFAVHLRKLTGVASIVVGVIAVIALMFPPGLGYAAVEGMEVTKPFWPFLWIYAIENTIGMTGMLVAPVVLFGFLFVVPLLDRSRDERSPRPRWFTALASMLLLLYAAALVYGIFAPKMQHMGM